MPLIYTLAYNSGNHRRCPPSELQHFHNAGPVQTVGMNVFPVKIKLQTDEQKQAGVIYKYGEPFAALKKLY